MAKSKRKGIGGGAKMSREYKYSNPNDRAEVLQHMIMLSETQEIKPFAKDFHNSKNLVHQLCKLRGTSPSETNFKQIGQIIH